MIVRALYNFIYGTMGAPWDIGPREELVSLVEAERLSPCRVIDLGCGAGANSIFLAERGFEVTGVDFSSKAIDISRERAAAAGVDAAFVIGDLTDLRGVEGPYDLLVDYGTLDDLSLPDRNRYLDTVLKLSRPGTRFLLWCFEWTNRWWERILYAVVGGVLGHMHMSPGEVEDRFGEAFEVERIGGSEHSDPSQFMAGYAVYLLTRREG